MLNNFSRYLRPTLILFIVANVELACAQGLPSAPEPTDSEQTSSQEQFPKPSLLTPLPRRNDTEPYQPISSRQRLRWFIASTIGPPHLLGGGIFSAALGTALDRPKEYGAAWRGFAERFGMRLTGISTGNAMEASIGALWGEDPRYFATPDAPIKARVRNIVKLTFEARQRRGNYAPAYARYIAVSGNNFLSNSWRAHSEANVQDALIRTAEGFAGRMASNAYEEFWPELKKRLLRRDR